MTAGDRTCVYEEVTRQRRVVLAFGGSEFLQKYTCCCLGLQSEGRWGFASCFAARGPSLDSRSLAQQRDCLQELAACENLKILKEQLWRVKA